MISKSSRLPRLPRVVFKRDLANYFSVDTRYLWHTLLTDELFADWGYDREEFVTSKRFPPGLTKCIYNHFNITDLDETLSQELKALDEPGTGHRAPEDD